MAVLTLDEVKVGMQSDLHKAIIDEFTAGDYLFQRIPFNFIANPVAGGAGWIAQYVKVKEESKGGFRDINGQYTDTFAKKETKSAEVKVYGGSFTIDRALRDTGGVENEVAFQMRQLVKGIKKGVSYYLINGAVATDSKQFDGLDAMLRSSSTDMEAKAGGFDLSTYEQIKANALEFTSVMNEFLSLLDEKPHVLLGNKTLINKIKACAKFAGLHTLTADRYGSQIDTYDGIPLLALDSYDGKEAVSITGGLTDLYAVRFGQDALTFASPSSGNVIDVIAPDFNLAQEQARGLVELRGTPILRNSKSCGVLRKIKVS